MYEYEITAQMLENFIIFLNELDVIQDSIRIYYRTSANAPLELPNTDTFSIPQTPIMPYFPDGVPHWIEKYNADGSVNILFGSSEFGGAFDSSHIGNTIQIFGRKGGGEKTNILAGQLSQDLILTINQNSQLILRIKNINDATGGADKEDIYKAQVFAPYRYGRGKPIIDTIDAQNTLHNTVIKHEITTPTFSEEFATVPLLHAFHYIVPKRNFDDFVFPDIETGDTLATYNTKFLTALDLFCNVQGSHDLSITNESITSFVYPEDINVAASLSTILKYRYPLSASLQATAYDYAGRIMDCVKFSTNYITDQKEKGFSTGSTPTEHAIVNTKEFDTVYIVDTVAGRNNKIVITFDYDRFNYIFTLELSTGIKTYKMFADELQSLIVQDIDANAAAIFGELRTWSFVSYIENADNPAKGKIVFKSPSTGKNSSIRFLDNGTNIAVADPQYNIYLFLGVEEKTYRPTLETGLIFESGCTYKYNNNILNLIFKSDYVISKDKAYADLGLIINHSVVAGPILTSLLRGENADQIEQLFEGSTLKITAFDSGGNPVDYMEYPNISLTEDTYGQLGGGDEYLPKVYTPGSVFQESANNLFTYATATLSTMFADNVLQSYYQQSYPTIYRVDIVRIIEDTIHPGNYIEDSGFTPIQFLEVNGNYTHDSSQEAGKVASLLLSLEQDATIGIGDDLMVKFYHRNEQGDIILVETEKLFTIMNGINPFTNYPTTQSVVDQGYSYNQYNKTSRTITFKFADGNLDSSIIYYGKGFADFAYLRFEYERQTYNSVKVQYKPNPYFPEGEAKALVDDLSNKNKRMIGLENLIKNVTFVPKPLKIQLTIRRNYSVSTAISEVYKLLYDQFAYENENSTFTIGSLFKIQTIKSAIGTIANQYGIIDIVISSDEDNDKTTDAATLKKYKFIFDENFFESIRQLENQNKTQLSGLAALYNVEVTGTLEEMMVS